MFGTGLLLHANHVLPMSPQQQTAVLDNVKTSYGLMNSVLIVARFQIQLALSIHIPIINAVVLKDISGP